MNTVKAVETQISQSVAHEFLVGQETVNESGKKADVIYISSRRENMGIAHSDANKANLQTVLMDRNLKLQKLLGILNSSPNAQQTKSHQEKLSVIQPNLQAIKTSWFKDRMEYVEKLYGIKMDVKA